MHIFEKSKSRGVLGEEIAREFFISKGFEVSPLLSIDEQYRKGYDFRVSKQGIVSNIEVKTDFLAGFTKNIFWEVEVDGKPGWTQKYGSESTVTICWVIPDISLICIFPANKLLDIEYIDYPEKEVINEHYVAKGFLVPLSIVKSKSKSFLY
jgi:hypothetical protein